VYFLLGSVGWGSPPNSRAHTLGALNRMLLSSDLADYLVPVGKWVFCSRPHVGAT
jgi:hypothetical protein